MPPDTAHVIDLSRDQIVERLNRGTRQRLGMDGLALVTAYREGTLEDPGFVWDLLILASLLPEDDPYFVKA